MECVQHGLVEERVALADEDVAGGLDGGEDDDGAVA